MFAVKYIVIIGNFVRAYGFDSRVKAEAYAARFDPMSATYDAASRWHGYSVTIMPVEMV